MKTRKIEAFKIIGISVRTTNENNQAAKDIPALWQKFMSEGLLNAIPNKVDNDIYCLYTHYEKDHTKPYTTLLGCKVKTLDNIPEGMVGYEFEGGNYINLPAKGDLMNGAVYNKWLEIWGMNLNRAFTADFEIYGSKSQNPNDAEVDILISLK